MSAWRHIRILLMQKFMHLFIYVLVWKKILNSYFNFISEVITSIFGRFGILTWRVLDGWVGNLASFWYVSDHLHRYINIGKAEIFHV